jgi:hypothetical protein
MTATNDLVELVHSSDVGFTEFFFYVLENVLFNAIHLHSLILLASGCGLVLHTYL